MQKKLAAQGVLPIASTPGEFTTVIKAEQEKWAQVIKAANITGSSDLVLLERPAHGLEAIQGGRLDPPVLRRRPAKDRAELKGAAGPIVE